MWRGRTVVSPQAGNAVRRRPRPILIGALLATAAFVVFCQEVMQQWLASLVGIGLLVILVAAIASRWAFSRTILTGLGRAAASAGGAAFGASAAAARRGGGEDVHSMLTARLDVGGPTDVDVAISGASEGVRQGDLVRAVGPRLGGLVRAVVTVNESTGRRFVNAGPLRGLAAVGIALGLPLLAVGMC